MASQQEIKLIISALNKTDAAFAELKKIEIEGNRLKNIMVETLFENEATVIKDIIERSSKPFLAKLYDLFRNISYIEESRGSKFYSIIKDLNPDFRRPKPRASTGNTVRRVS